MDISLFALSGILIAISSGVMVFVMFTVGRTQLHILWGVFCISVFIWGLGGFFIGTTTDPARAELWWRLAHIGIAFIPALFLHFVYTFLKLKRSKTILVIYASALAFSILALFSNLLIAHMRLVFGEFYYDSPAGLLYPLFTTYFFGLTIFSHYLLYKSYKEERAVNEATTLDRTRIRYFFLGMLISFAGGSLSFLPVYGIDIYPIGNFAVIMYPIIIGYAILRHRLFDVRVATAQGLTFLLWIFLAVRVIFSTNGEDAVINGTLLITVIILGVFLIRSISKEIGQREKIEKQELELEAVNKQQENLLHFISHEIKGYLTKSEAGFSAIVEGDFGATSPELHEMSNMALTEVRKGVRTVMDILDASNLKRGTVSFKKDIFDMRDVVTNVVEHLKPAADEKHLTIETSIAWEIPCKVNGDEEKIRDHVIRNLVDNAIKYTPTGSIRIEVARKGSIIRFAVEDSGVGITPEDMQRLFTEGGHGKDSIKVNVHSTGYGLYIAKTIITAHSGRIWAESKGAGTGSRFVVELPAA